MRVSSQTALMVGKVWSFPRLQDATSNSWQKGKWWMQLNMWGIHSTIFPVSQTVDLSKVLKRVWVELFNSSSKAKISSIILLKQCLKRNRWKRNRFQKFSKMITRISTKFRKKSLFRICTRKSLRQPTVSRVCKRFSKTIKPK